MASSPVISWQIEGGKVETVTDFIFLGFKITVDGYCSQENLKDICTLGRKLLTNLDSILKSRDITLHFVLNLEIFIFPAFSEKC